MGRHMMSAEMLMEEIDIIMNTGRCPRCNQVLVFDVDEDEWQARCPDPECHGLWGASIGFDSF